MNVETILFLAIGIVALAAAVAMVTTPNMIYSALYMVVVFLATALIYILYQASLIAMLQNTVYAGGIMVLFLFVIMLIGAEQMSHTENLRWQRPMAFGLAALLVAETAYLALAQLKLPHPANPGADFGNPNAVSLSLFSQYLLPFEVTSVLLLVALIGAIVLTRLEGKKQR